jgi:uncharacterized membrane protein YbaN (DUF454 family)
MPGVLPRVLRRVAIFVVGLLLILTGLALIVLPGPLTIPPILLGLWLWSREFEFARRWLRPVRARAAVARRQAEDHPVHTALVTGLGLVCAAAIVWTALRYDLVDRLVSHGSDLVGLG